MNYQSVYISILKTILENRIKKNSSYSLRAFAKSLKTSAGSLSDILKSKRPLTLEKALAWVDLLGLELNEKEAFLDAVSKDSTLRLNQTEKKSRELKEKYESYLLRLDQFKLINDWYHFGILNLTELNEFKSDIKWISEKLKIEKELITEAINRLKRLGLLEEKDGVLRRSKNNLETSTDIPSEVIRNFHKQNIQRALISLKDDDVMERDITSIMMPVDLTKMEEAKKKIKNFRKELAAFLRGKNQDRVYSLNIQLFPQSTECEK